MRPRTPREFKIPQEQEDIGNRLNICGVPPGGRQEVIDRRAPPGWEIRQSRKTGRLYYANPRLKITQWQRPSI